MLPVNGSREALFSFAQTVLDPAETRRARRLPNPFYQIYEGATLLAGAQPYFVNSLAAQRLRAPTGTRCPRRCGSARACSIACSPSNPDGRVMTLEEWKQLFELSDRHGFVIVSDECYCEIYFDEAKPPLGALAAAQAARPRRLPRLVVMGSLSKRSNVPGHALGLRRGRRGDPRATSCSIAPTTAPR